MGTKLATLCFTLALSLWSSISHAQLSANYDAKTIQAVSETVAAQTAIETVHNAELEKVSKKKKTIAGYTASMATIKEAYRYTMQNVKGFGEESKIYREVFNTSKDIALLIPKALNGLGKQPFYTGLCYVEINSLVSEAVGCANTFVNIVNNGKVPFKIDNRIHIKQTSDGYNFLTRADRYTMANDVLTRLRFIRYQLEAIVFMCEYTKGIGDFVYAFAPDSWLSYLTAKSNTETIINLFKEL